MESLERQDRKDQHLPRTPIFLKHSFSFDFRQVKIIQFVQKIYLHFKFLDLEA